MRLRGDKKGDPAKIQGQFRTYLKRLRKAAELSQRKLSALAGMNSSCIGELECNDPKRWGWPSEDTLSRIAVVLGANRDEMLGMGGRISEEVQQIIVEHPIEICAFLRAAKHLNPEDWELLTEGLK